jgi:nucleoside-triphosphatase
MTNPRVIILSGGRRIGKTTVCAKAVALARSQVRTCSGVITPSRSAAIRDIQNVRTGTVRTLTCTQNRRHAVTAGRYCFDPEALAWGEDVILNAVPCDLLVIDELGPLELTEGRGWVAALDILRRREYGLALIVVRLALVARLRSAIPEVPTEVLCVTHQNRDGLSATLYGILMSCLGQPQ